MRTTLSLDDDVSVRLERLRKERKSTFKALVNEALRRGLDALEPPKKKRAAYKVRPVSATCLVPSVDCIPALLDAADGEWRR